MKAIRFHEHIMLQLAPRCASTAVEKCEACDGLKPNVGNWSDGRRICGGCKVLITFSQPKFRQQLERDLGGKITWHGALAPKGQA